ncbi:hypothetical protein GCM10008090_24420 [Arenicella chitinivorans]|uniref:DUF1772 domain-containing protein n=1 Tax=Arenicella chitinivorans TaxID=1329800 RepID=A0A918VMT9_9GAMM|nr:DUF1772 domain-containing protein [Arenicella chitinivorans]GHA13784.1 hypothetical protein GCM10008090_24420 [Arenicella chitinivorans]
MIDLLTLFTTLMLGLFAGSLLTEAMILVPYWRRMEPTEFLRLHGTLGPRLFQFFAPLTTCAVVLAIVTAVLVGTENSAWLLAGVLSAIVLSLFFIYFRKANNRFATHTITAEELPDELARWSTWHWLRTGILIIAFASSIYGHTA